MDAEAMPRAAGRRVLIIDDNEDLAISQAILLECRGCRVAVARDGREGARLAIEGRFDVVFIDIGLPGMSGHEVARTIRAVLAEPPVLLAQTAYGQPEDARRSRAAGFDAHLVKPVDPDEIVRHALEGRAALAPSTSETDERRATLERPSRDCLSA